MAYHIIRYTADKPESYGGEKLPATGSVQYTRDNKTQAEQMLGKLYDISANQRYMTILKRTRYTFRCENLSHKYLFKIVSSDNKDDVIENMYL
jgi:hypothetical protein